MITPEIVVFYGTPHEVTDEDWHLTMTELFREKMDAWRQRRNARRAARLADTSVTQLAADVP
jgi:hypothetical protein